MRNLAYFTLLAYFYPIMLVKVQGTKDCDLVCPANEIRPVCGSDGETYQSKCMLRLTKCTSGRKLLVTHTGACRAPPSCVNERKRVLKSIREQGLLRIGIFVPKCDKDGRYSAMQCSQPPNVCWCVNKYGDEVENSRVYFKKPECGGRYSRSNPRAQNERYMRILKGRYPTVYQVPVKPFAMVNTFLKGCSKENRMSFNKKVVANFKKEMAKLSGKKGKLNFQDILQWKMDELDVDKSGYLRHKEVKSIIKKFKKAFSPKKCGKTLFFYCDKDRDDVISRKEWFACLGFQGSKINQPATSTCFKEHIRTSELQAKDKTRGLFVPSCNADGTYKSVQCEKVSKYCWCVDPISGKNIPNTSVLNSIPDCTKHPRPTRVPSRPPTYIPIKRRTLRKPQDLPVKSGKTIRSQRGKKIKECDDTSWARFSKELVLLIRNELEAITASRLGVRDNSTRHGPLNLLEAIQFRLPDSMILSWKFSRLDSDRDRLMSDDELFVSHMKKMFGRIRRGRKCSKKLARSCDSDKNGGLSLNEWRRCLRRKTQKIKPFSFSRPGFLGR